MQSNVRQGSVMYHLPIAHVVGLGAYVSVQLPVANQSGAHNRILVLSFVLGEKVGLG